MSFSNFKPMRLIYDTSGKIEYYAPIDEKTLDIQNSFFHFSGFTFLLIKKEP